MGCVDKEIVRIPLKDVARKLKSVPKDAQVLDEVRALGISLGDA